MKPMSRLATSAIAATFAASALLIPAAASAAPLQTEDAVSSTCTVTGGDLKWGVKESFRSYISGSIANGSWTTAGGASYETPLFGWSNPVGEIDAETGEGSVSFTGSINFTGHDGVLNLLLANPTLVLAGDGTAQLLLDTRSNNAQGELVIDEQQAYLGKIEGIEQADPARGEFVFADAPAVLTADGADAFGGFYASGDALDPVALSLQLSPCAGQVSAPAPAPESEDASANTAADQPSNSVPWVPIVLGGLAVVVIGVTVGMLIAGRRKGVGVGAPAVSDEAGEADIADAAPGTDDPSRT